MHFLFQGPWRAVLVLGVTQILAWGVIIYPPVLTLPKIAAERGWSLAFAMSGLSLGLLVAGIVSPRVGALIDRHGGHRVMPFGSLIGAAGLAALSVVDHPAAYLGVWAVLGVATACSLYDSAFATLGRIFGAAARRPITLLTFAGGFASTVSWPATHLLLDAIGWRGTYLVYAALLAFVAAPLHAFVLPREHADPNLAPVTASAVPHPQPVKASGTTFVPVAAGFAAFAFITSGLSAHLLAMFGRAGLDAATVVMIGTLFGPSQVCARLAEFAFAGRRHPLSIARFAVALVIAAFAMLSFFGVTAATAAAFAVMFGASNGLITIAKGTVPLALFGASGYGKLVGRLAAPQLAMQAAAPLVLAFAVERIAGAGALAVTAAAAVAALASFCAIRLGSGAPRS